MLLWKYQQTGSRISLVGAVGRWDDEDGYRLEQTVSRSDLSQNLLLFSWWRINTPCMETRTPTVARRIAVADALTSIKVRTDRTTSSGHAEMDSVRLILGMGPAERIVGQRKMQWRRCKSNDRVVKIAPSDFKLNMLGVQIPQQ